MLTGMRWKFLPLIVVAVILPFLLPVSFDVLAAQNTPTATPPQKPTPTPGWVWPTTAPIQTLTRAPSSTPTGTATLTPYPSLTPDDRPPPTPDRKARNMRVPILMYHYVSVPPADADNYRIGLSVTPEQFRLQMQYLAENGYHTVTLDDVLYALAQGAALPPKPVVLTFDDGYTDMYTNAFPIMREYGFTGTFFIVTAWIDEQNPNYLNWAQVQEMAAAGMRIETHTKTHADLTDKPYDFLVYEILGSIESIEAYTDRRPRFLCYPAGAYDDYVRSLLPGFDLWAAVTTEAGTRHYTDALYTMKRVRIANDTTLAQFASFLEWGREGDS
jgi:peptidoglycan/xylan/chitin deacetylase (PgdA/CDA1 family)